MPAKAKIGTGPQPKATGDGYHPNGLSMFTRASAQAAHRVSSVKFASVVRQQQLLRKLECKRMAARDDAERARLDRNIEAKVKFLARLRAESRG
jgi:hypothetical protein